MLLSGDAHYGAVFAHEYQHQQFHEVLSSSLNLPITEPGRAKLDLNDYARQGDVVFEANFGLLEIDWAARRVHASLRDTHGHVLLSQAIPFD